MTALQYERLYWNKTLKMLQFHNKIKYYFVILAILERFFLIFHQFIGKIKKIKKIHLLRRTIFKFYPVTYD